MQISNKFFRCMAVQALIAAALGMLATASSADEPAAPSDEERDARLATMKQQAAAYTLTLADDGAKLALHDEPVLRFSNPVSGVPDGIVAMWKAGKRPAVFAQVFRTKDGLWVHECQSLATAGLTMRKGNKLFWEPKQGAEAFRRMDDAPSPAASPGRRLIQMKELAAGFSAADDFKISAADQDTTRHELRLLTTPIYRYEDPAAGIVDGAVFAYVHGTDPEVFLVLEGQTDKEGEARWHYTLAPMTCWAVTVDRNDRTVWSVPERLNESTPRDLYHVWLHRVLTIPFSR